MLPRKGYCSLGRRKGRASNALEPEPPDTLPPSAPSTPDLTTTLYGQNGKGRVELILDFSLSPYT